MEPAGPAFRASFDEAPPRAGRPERPRSVRPRPRPASAPPVRARGGRVAASGGEASLTLERDRSFVFFFTSENCEALPGASQSIGCARLCARRVFARTCRNVFNCSKEVAICFFQSKKQVYISPVGEHFL
jgi:hypothetical protein